MWCLSRASLKTATVDEGQKLLLADAAVVLVAGVKRGKCNRRVQK